MSTIGIIPARGGSKRIPDKNLVELGGVSLIEWTIRAACNSDLDDIIVTSDNPEILRVASQYDVYTLKRPRELAEDDTPTMPVIQHALNHYLSRWDRVMLLQPTSPFRTSEHINEALQTQDHALVSVMEGIHPIKSYDIEGKPFLLPAFYNKHEHKCFTRNGAIFLARKWLIDEAKLWTQTPALYRMPKLNSIDIDDEEDLVLAQALVQTGVMQIERLTHRVR